MGAARVDAMLHTSLEQALQRCIAFASRFGTIRLTKPVNPQRREFFLELDEPFAPRLRWTLSSLQGGTGLTVGRSLAIGRLAAWRGSTAGRQLERRLQLLPHLASLKIAVVGGGTGLYSTL